MDNYAKIADWEFNRSVLYSVDNNDKNAKDFKNNTSASIHNYDLNKSGILLDATPGKSHIQIKKKQTKHYDSFYNITTPNLGDEVVIDIDSTNDAESVFLAKTYTDKPMNQNIGFGWSDNDNKTVEHSGQFVRCSQKQAEYRKYYVYELPPLESVENRVPEADVYINAQSSTYTFYDTEDGKGKTKTIVENINTKTDDKHIYRKMAIHCKSPQSVTQDDYTFKFGTIKSSGISDTLDGGFLVYFKRDESAWGIRNFIATCENFPSETYPKYNANFESTGYINEIVDSIHSEIEIYLQPENGTIKGQLNSILSANTSSIVKAQQYKYDTKTKLYKINNAELSDYRTLYLYGDTKVSTNFDDIEEEYKAGCVQINLYDYVYDNQAVNALPMDYTNDDISQAKLFIVNDIVNDPFLMIEYNGKNYIVPSDANIIDFNNAYYKRTDNTSNIEDRYQTCICLAYCAFDGEQYDEESDTIPYKILETRLIFNSDEFSDAFESIEKDIGGYVEKVSSVGF